MFKSNEPNLIFFRKSGRGLHKAVVVIVVEARVEMKPCNTAIIFIRILKSR